MSVDSAIATQPTITITPPQRDWRASAATIHDIKNGGGPPVMADIGGEGSFFGKEGPSFKTVLDTINPLQHIPIISTIYQKLTGDVPSPAAQLAGGALFGGPIGLAAAIGSAALGSAVGSGGAGTAVASAAAPSVTGSAAASAATASPVAAMATAPASNSALRPLHPQQTASIHALPARAPMLGAHKPSAAAAVAAATSGDDPYAGFENTLDDWYNDHGQKNATGPLAQTRYRNMQKMPVPAKAAVDNVL